MNNELIMSEQPIIEFNGPIAPSMAIIHSNDVFDVQWAAINIGNLASLAFTDLLVITQIPEGCPGSDDQEHSVVYDSDTEGINPEDFSELPLDPQQEGRLMKTTVGPFPVGDYRINVTLGYGLYDIKNWSCIKIIE
jgi:hypothetical protein